MKNWKRYALAAAGVALVVILAVVLWQAGRSTRQGAEKACTIAIRCDTVLDHLDSLGPDKAELVPADGVLLSETETVFSEGESAFDLLKRTCQDKGIHLEFSNTPGYGVAYIEGIGNLYELDCGERSGWLYHVNGQSPDVACSAYVLQDGDAVEFLYSCDWGQDLG